MAISGSIVCVSLNYIVSLLVGFVLKKKYSVILVLLNILSCLTVDILVPDVKKLEFIDIVKGTLLDQILADTVSTCSFHIFLFILGIVLAQEIKQRLELEITNAKLKVFKEIDDISIRNSERIDIARELHDSIGHHLAAISTNLQLANALCKDEAKEPIQDAYDTSKVLMNDIRGIVSALKQDKSLDLYEAITKIIKSIKSPKITFDMDKSLVIQNQKIKHVLFRTVQEIITNAMKYSEAESLFISIKYENNFIILNAKDDGVGCENLKLSNGLSGMTERIEELFGCVEFRTSKNNGFVTNIKIPYGGNND
jgi:signal transduction histidine kinase